MSAMVVMHNFATAVIHNLLSFLAPDFGAGNLLLPLLLLSFIPTKEALLFGQKTPTATQPGFSH